MISISRPTTLSEYRGQSKVKSILQAYFDGFANRPNAPFPHTIISGKAGQGKTTLANIIANTLGRKTFTFIASTIDSIDQIRSLIELNPNCIIFLDEIHGLDRRSVEKLYSMMEDFTYNGEQINPFTLLGATTELGEILKDRRPFYDRFKLALQLDSYQVEDLKEIADEQGNKYFDGFGNIGYKIAMACRRNPRNAIRLVDQLCMFDGSLGKVLDANDIITPDGITSKDIKIMRFLVNNKTAGVQGICAYMDMDINLYLADIEPYLLQSEYIVRTPKGRKIGVKGIMLLNSDIVKGI